MERNTAYIAIMSNAQPRKDNKVALKNAIILSKYFLGDDYWILTAQTLFHDFENYLYVAYNGSSKNYNLNTPIDMLLFVEAV